MSTIRNIITAIIWLGVCSAAATTTTEPIPPSQDPFYTAPHNFEIHKPGTILRTRSALGLVPIIANSSAAYNILYRTTDARDQPSWAVTTLLVPNTTNKAAAKQLVTYQLAYDTPAVDWGPSYGLYNVYSLPNSFGSTPEAVHISQALGRGWYVSVPDYEGPQASFLAGIQAGHAVLDAVRASALMDIFDSSDTQLSLWGYSGGGFATAWAAELQAQYAPELNISGIAVGAPLTNYTKSFYQNDNTSMTFLIPSTIIGLVSQFPEAEAALVNALNKDGPFNATGWFAATKRNFVDNFSAYDNQEVLDYFVDRQSPLDLPYIPEIVSSQTLLGFHGVPKAPYFAYMSVNDYLGIAGVDALVAKYCAAGANIVFQRNSVGDHNAESLNGVPGVLDFFDAVFGGTFAPTQGCKVENVTIDISTQSNPQ